ncbi:hypothetical protein PPL_11815 [Heterostelium album PN500]|uniref:Uncharacterized protein n=1 Tax=Heterostelium pallidum (strain ATCC 26659 / Pp 5 / PN500) TaxID=670386 RepID=D3BUJ4_HETP5|nr:hypothetical protein PPL_11815 [Heterostelium album PN500]EFA74782.1 hypothetical protein PPL_11815 [Heterostelium album PN500]|eukprot:XP_020426916.1 hypothetical protein PPL_11815 [Heterostelium album PN500]
MRRKPILYNCNRQVVHVAWHAYRAAQQLVPPELRLDPDLERHDVPPGRCRNESVAPHRSRPRDRRVSTACSVPTANPTAESSHDIQSAQRFAGSRRRLLRDLSFSWWQKHSSTTPNPQLFAEKYSNIIAPSITGCVECDSCGHLSANKICKSEIFGSSLASDENDNNQFSNGSNSKVC